MPHSSLALSRHLSSPSSAVLSAYPISVPSFNNKRITADRLDKLDRIFTAGAEGKPGVRTQIGFEPTEHATLHGYSTSLPSNPSPPPVTALPFRESSLEPAALSPRSVSVDGPHHFPLSNFPDFLLSAEERKRLNAMRAAAAAAPGAAATTASSFRAAPFTRPASPTIAGLSPGAGQPESPTAAMSSLANALPHTAAEADDEADGEAAAPPPQQRNTLLHYWQTSSTSLASAARSSSQLHADDEASEDIVEIIDASDADRKARGTGNGPSKPTTGFKRKQMQGPASEQRVREQLERREVELKELQTRVEAATQQLREQDRAAQRALEGAHEQHAASERELSASHERYRARVLHELIPILREAAHLRRAEAERQLLLDQHEVGRMVSVANGITVQEHWMESDKVKDIHRRMRALAEDEERLAEERQRVRRKMANLKLRQKRAADSAKDGAPTAASSSSSFPSSAPALPDDNGGFARPAPVDLLDDDFFSVRLRELQREQGELGERLHALSVKKQQVIRQQKLRQDELNSKFSVGEALHSERYLITELLGKGGFSEVFKAYDLHEMRPRGHQGAPAQPVLVVRAPPQLHQARRARVQHPPRPRAPGRRPPAGRVRAEPEAQGRRGGGRGQLRLRHRPRVLRRRRPGLPPQAARSAEREGEPRHRPAAVQGAAVLLAALAAQDHPLRPQAGQHPLPRPPGQDHR